MDLSNYSEKDTKIILANEGATAYQLLQLGISKEGYNRFMKDFEADKKTPPPRTTGKEKVTPAAPEKQELLADFDENEQGQKPITPAKVETKPHAPQLGRTSATKPRAEGSHAIFRQVVIVGPSGIPQKLAEKQAQKLVRANPTDYRIIGDV